MKTELDKLSPGETLNSIQENEPPIAEARAESSEAQRQTSVPSENKTRTAGPAQTLEPFDQKGAWEQLQHTATDAGPAAQLAKQIADLELLTSRYSVPIPSEPKKRLWDSVLEAAYVPPEVWQLIVSQFKDIRDEVLNRQPAEPTNKVQSITRSTLAIFNNLSSLFIYVVLLGTILKVIVIFGAHNARVVRAIEGMSVSIIPFICLVVILCLFFVRALQWISRFVRSYRVMTIIGALVALKFMIKTSILLFTADSFSGMGGTLWQFVSGALK